MIRLGLQLPIFTYPDLPDDALFDRVVEVALAAEESGFDALFLMDHVQQIGGVGRPEDPMLEPYTLLGALAARTSRIRLGTLVTGKATLFVIEQRKTQADAVTEALTTVGLFCGGEKQTELGNATKAETFKLG